MSSTSFGQWYKEQKTSEASPGSGNGTAAAASSGSWFGEGSDQVLPLFGSVADAAGNFSFGSMRAAMEAQLPKQVLGMSYPQRFKVFCGLILLSALFFALAFFVGMPMIAVRPQKFALSFTCGSLTFMGSFGILKGPAEHLQSMLTAERLPFTCIYVGSMVMTLYLTFTKGGVTGYVFVLSASACQLMALLWYLITFLPGGSMGLSLLLSAMLRILSPLLVGCAKIQAMCFQQCFRWMTRS